MTRGKAASTQNIFGISGEVKRELVLTPATQPPISCPQCGSIEVVKGGWRKDTGKLQQRLLCKTCSYRFTERHSNLKQIHSIVSDSHLCAMEVKKDQKPLALSPIERPLISSTIPIFHSGPFTIEIFNWRSGKGRKGVQHFCKQCKVVVIGNWANRHSQQCQHCNTRDRYKNMRDSNKQRKEARENHVEGVKTL